MVFFLSLPICCVLQVVLVECTYMYVLVMGSVVEIVCNVCRQLPTS